MAQPTPPTPPQEPADTGQGQADAGGAAELGHRQGQADARGRPERLGLAAGASPAAPRPAGPSGMEGPAGRSAQTRTQLVTRSRPASVSSRSRSRPADTPSSVKRLSSMDTGRRPAAVSTSARATAVPDDLGDQVADGAPLGDLQLHRDRTGLERDQPDVALAADGEQPAALLRRVTDQLGQLLVQPAQPEQRLGAGQHVLGQRVDLLEDRPQPAEQGLVASRRRRRPRSRRHLLVRSVDQHGAGQQPAQLGQAPSPGGADAAHRHPQHGRDLVVGPRLDDRDPQQPPAPLRQRLVRRPQRLVALVEQQAGVDRGGVVGAVEAPSPPSSGAPARRAAAPAAPPAGPWSPASRPAGSGPRSGRGARAAAARSSAPRRGRPRRPGGTIAPPRRAGRCAGRPARPTHAGPPEPHGPAGRRSR